MTLCFCIYIIELYQNKYYNMAKKVSKPNKQKNKAAVKSKSIKKKKIGSPAGRKKDDIQIDKDFSIDVNESLKIDDLYDDIEDDNGEDLLI